MLNKCIMRCGLDKALLNPFTAFTEPGPGFDWTLYIGLKQPKRVGGGEGIATL